MTASNRSVLITAVIAMTIAASAKAHADPRLVGTLVSSKSEEISEIQDLINDYNSDFGATLPDVGVLLDKIEGDNSADFTEGNLTRAMFDFFEQDGSGSKGEDIFDASTAGAGSQVQFSNTEIDFTTNGFASLDNPVMGFEVTDASAPSFFYYVSKDGSDGWSLWAYMDGFNPVYTDAGTGSGSELGSGFTRGLVSNESLAYDPIGGGISHISFYTSASGIPNVIPEPTSLAIWGLGIAVVGVGHRRRRVRSTPL